MNLGNVAAVFYCGFAPRRAARANLGLSLGQAYLVHWVGMGWLGLALALSFVVHGSFREVDEFLGGWAKIDWEVIAGTAIVIAVVEMCHLLIGLMLVGPAAQDEPVRDTYRHAQRTAWIHAGHAAWAMLVASSTLAWFWEWGRPFRDAWYRYQTGAFGATQPKSGPAPAMSISMWLARHEEVVVYLVVVSAAAWVIWGWLRAALVQRKITPASHHKLCEYCGYNLNFIEAHERCPECGAALTLSLGNHRHATAWACRRGLSPDIWVACAWRAWRHSESSFLAMASAGGARPALSFLGWSGLLTAGGLLSGIVLPLGLLDEQAFGSFEFCAFASTLASFFVVVALVLAALTAAVVGILVSRTTERNRCASALQVACYCAGFLPVWAAVSAGSVCTIMPILDRTRTFQYQWLVVLLWFGLNAAFFLVYVGGVARRMKYVRYANS
jgi:fumarate reductase subunit D